MKSRTSFVIRASALLAWFGVASCAAVPESSPGASVDDAGRETGVSEVKRPFMIREAKVPAGFPPPGPVGQVILKEYPAYRAARVTALAGSESTANAMFQPLFRHIKKNDIAMTAPVELTYSPHADSRQSEPVAMSFLYGDPAMGTAERQGDVEVVDLPAQTVLSVAVRGGYEKGFAVGIEQLRQWLAKNPGRFEVVGPPRFMGYNSPFVPSFLRIGETQLPVRPLEPKAD